MRNKRPSESSGELTSLPRGITVNDVDAVQNFYRTYDISPELLDVSLVFRNLVDARRQGLSDAEAVHAAVLAALREQIASEQSEPSRQGIDGDQSGSALR